MQAEWLWLLKSPSYTIAEEAKIICVNVIVNDAYLPTWKVHKYFFKNLKLGSLLTKAQLQERFKVLNKNSQNQN